MIKKLLNSVLTRILILGLNFALGIITARYLLPEGKGIYTLYLLIMSYLINLSDLGSSNAAIYYAGVSARSGQKQAVYSACLGLSTIVSIVALGGFYAYLYLIKPPFMQMLISPGILASFAVILPLSLILHQYRNIELGLERITSYNLLNIWQNLSLSVFMVVAIVFLRTGYQGAILAYGLSTILVALYMLAKNIKNIAPASLLDWKNYREFINYGIKVYTVGIFALVILRFDSFIIANYQPAVQLGYYSIAVSLGEMLLQFPNVISLLLFASSCNDRDGQTSVQLTCRLTRISTFILLFAGVLLYFLADFLIALLYSQQYQAAVLPFKLLLPGIFIYSIFQFIYGDILGKGRPELVWPPIMVSGIITILLDFLLIPQYGIQGAALASTISYTIATVLILFIYKRLVKVKLKDILLIRKEDLEIILQMIKGLKTKSG